VFHSELQVPPQCRSIGARGQTDKSALPDSLSLLSAFSMQSVEKLHIQKVLNYTKGNKAETARLLEIGVATLYRKLDEYNIQ